MYKKRESSHQLSQSSRFPENRHSEENHQKFKMKFALLLVVACCAFAVNSKPTDEKITLRCSGSKFPSK
jgi:hypothetical protein